MKRWLLGCVVVIAIASVCVNGGRADEPPTTADLKITFVYASDTYPEPVPIDTSNDPWCSVRPGPVFREDLVVDRKTSRIKNVVLLPDRKSNLTLDDVDAETLKKARTPVNVEIGNCAFSPHVFSTIVGGSIITKNLGPNGHYANFNFFAAAAPFAGVIIPAGGIQKIDIKIAERTPIPIDCHIHPWMRAFVIITETPFVGISNEKGELTIEKLPANRLIRLKVWHESSKGAIEKVDLDGKIVHWKKGVIELKLKPGLNDLGTCKLTPEHFKQ